MTPSSEFVGRIEAVEHVDLVARVTAYLDKRLFTEGLEVKKGDLLYRLEQGPFQADVQAKQASIAQFNAQLQNAAVTLTRQRTLLSSPAGQQSAVDLALANQDALKAQVLGAQAQLRTSQINLDYTEIRAPIDGKIGRTAVTPGNVVSPSSGVLTTIVSQDPMYAVFPVPARSALELRQRYADRGGLLGPVVKVRMSDGTLYGQSGKLDFFDNTVARTTDTIILRAVMPNPELPRIAGSDIPRRGLIDGELVTVIVEDPAPVEVLTIPRAAVLSDQAGDYVYVVDGQNKVVQQRVKLGQSAAPTSATVASGLNDGDAVVVEGIQRVRPGIVVSPAPAGQPPDAAAAPPRS
jgi:membrane fusion protein (multidrug efflux system)